MPTGSHRGSTGRSRIGGDRKPRASSGQGFPPTRAVDEGHRRPCEGWSDRGGGHCRTSGWGGTEWVGQTPAVPYPPWIPVSHIDDPRIAEFVGLRDAELRRRRESADGDLAGIFIAEGDLVVERALKAEYCLRSMLVDATRTAPLPTAVPADVPVYAASPDVVLKITGMGVHRGCMASFARRPVLSVAEVLSDVTRVVVLEGLSNPTNLGIIARSAVGLGAEALLLDPSCCDPLYRRASRVAMGEVFALPYATTRPFPDGLEQVTEAGFSLMALTPDPTAESIDDLVFAPDEKVALVLGSEGPGLTEATMAAVDRRVRIPIHGGVDSLNVAAAAAIACYVLGRGRT